MPTPWDHILAFVVGVGIPLLAVVQRRTGQPSEPPTLAHRDKIALYWSNSAQTAVLAAVTIVIWKLGGRTLADLGLTAAPEKLGLGLAIAAIFLLGYCADAWHKLRPGRIAKTRERWRRETPFMPSTPREVAHSFSMVATAAVGEEIIYRGFLISYVTYFTGTAPLGLTAAVALPAVVFAIPHLYQGGLRGLHKIMVPAAMFGAIVVVTGSLWIAIGLHFLVDAIGMSLGPRLAFAAGGDGASRSPSPTSDLTDRQIAASWRAASTTCSTLGRKSYSSGGEYGTGVSGAVTRRIGASR